jgi:hypothetical protein
MTITNLNIGTSLFPQRILGILYQKENNVIKLTERFDNCLLLETEECSLKDYFSINGIDFAGILSEKEKFILKQTNCKNLNLFHFLKKEEFKKRLIMIFNKLNSFDNCYLEVFIHNDIFLKTLKPWKFDKSKINLSDDVLENIDNNIFEIEHSPKYSLCDTITGRLTVLDGFNILVANKSLRKYMTDLNGNSLFELDLSALEPSILFSILMPEFKFNDLYNDVCEKWFNNSLTREQIKKIVISTCYGASTKLISYSVFGQEIVDNEKKLLISNQIENFKKDIDINLFIEKLRLELNENGFIKNYFGRPIWPKLNTNTHDGTLVNNYIQSTSVDLCLNLFDNLSKEYNIVPHAVIHDALYFSVNDSNTIEDIKKNKKLKSSIFNIELSFKIRCVNE